MQVEINGNVLEVASDTSFEELIQLSNEIMRDTESITELKIDQENVSQSTLEEIRELPISDFSESEIELFSTSVQDIASEILGKAMEYIKRVEKVQDLTRQDIEEVAEGFQWLSFALVQINSILEVENDDHLKDLIDRNSRFCQNIANYVSDKGIVNPQIKKRIDRELESYKLLINKAKELL